MKGTGQRYEVRIEGHLAPHRLRHFEGLTVLQEARGETLVEGTFRDQPALFGLLNWLHGLGISLVSVRRLGQSTGTGEEREPGIETGSPGSG